MLRGCFSLVATSCLSEEHDITNCKLHIKKTKQRPKETGTRIDIWVQSFSEKKKEIWKVQCAAMIYTVKWDYFDWQGYFDWYDSYINFFSSK